MTHNPGNLEDANVNKLGLWTENCRYGFDMDGAHAVLSHAVAYCEDKEGWCKFQLFLFVSLIF